MSHIWHVSLFWFRRLTFTPGVKMHPQYTHLNRISPPLAKASTDCCAHLLSFSLFTPPAMHKWWVQLWDTVYAPSLLQINFSHRWNCSGTALSCGTVASETTVCLTVHGCIVIIKIHSTFSYSIQGFFSHTTVIRAGWICYKCPKAKITFWAPIHPPLPLYVHCACIV